AGGTALQTSTSASYLNPVSSTTTFYVSELNTSTGCESDRTAVLVTVAPADGITSSVDNSTICIGSSINLNVVNSNATPLQNYTYTWTNAQAGSGLVSATGASQTVTPTSPGTYTYDVAGVDGLCNALSSVVVTVDPFLVTISPINVSCNSGNDGSFSLVSSSCGTAPFSYSIDGGAFGTIPANLTAGTYTLLVKDANNITSEPITLNITQPSTTITNPTVTNASVCQDATSATVTASANLSTTSSGSQVVAFNVASQPTEFSSSAFITSVSASPNPFATGTMAALPAGAVVTGVTLGYNGIQVTGNSWQSDVSLGLSGAVANNYTSGSTLDFAGTLNYIAAIPVGSVNTAGGTVTLHYFDYFNDNAGAEATFPLGAGVATLTIDYTFPNPATVSWWDAPTGGNQIGTGSPFETVGTSVLPTTATPGVYTVYAQGQNGACPSPGRTAATVTVKAKTFNTINQTACNSFTLNTQTYTATGTYTQTLTNAAGCDSIITLNLIINNSNGSTTSITACNSYTWTNGTTYTASGTYSQTLTNIVGCDSVATLNLTINNSNTGTDVITACDAYTWINGVTYTANNNTATFTLTNAAGCDSVVTLNLTINNSNTGTDVITACDSYTWIDGVTYTASNNSATFTLTNAAGCDSVVTLNLTINNSTTGTDVITACDSYTWIDGVTYTASNNSATFTLTNAI
ncbi:MAG: beta strand repeat-containing protein, partial [Bacteroidota bacterium]